MALLRRTSLPLIATVSAAALIALLVFGVLALGTNRTLDAELAAGHPPLAPAQNRVLPMLGGGRSSLSAFHGHTVLLNFFASWCPPCREEAPLIALAQKELAPYGGTVVGVNYKDTVEAARAFLSSYHARFPVLRDRTGSFAEAFGTEALPESFLIGPEGRIHLIARGAIAPSFVERAVAYAQEMADGRNR